MSITQSQIDLYRSLFKGRQEVFAKRWETKDRSGYSPAYSIDWDQYQSHKATGGTIKDYPHKSYAVLSESEIRDHLEGKEVVGLYPLLENNTTWFAAVDFDENNWRTEIVETFKQCLQYNMPAYIERSRSGNGAHLWIFYEQQYPAVKSRVIIRHLLKDAGVDIKNSNSSFDRIFPNQDYHTGKGIGNLIALPLQKSAVENENSCFIDPDTLEAYADQWAFLASIEKIDSSRLNEIFDKLSNSNSIINVYPALQSSGNKVEIILHNTITISRNDLPSELVLFLRDNLRVTNSNYFIKKATGHNTYGIMASSTVLEEHTDRLIIPRGCIGTLLRYCKGNKLHYNLTDNRKRLPEVEYTPIGHLYDYQQPTLITTDKKEMGVIVALPGTGKTFVGLSIIAQKKQPALIIVHRRQLFDQWMQRIQAFLGIPKYKIGRITKGQVDVGEQVTVAMIQSLNRDEVLNKIENAFGTVIIDECHHLPSESYKSILQRLSTYYLYGLTATPIRKNKDEKLIFAQIGEIIHEIVLPQKLKDKQSVSINIRDTDLDIPFNEVNDKYETLSDILVHDTARNNLIATDIIQEINNGRSVLVLTERKSHIDILNLFLKQDCEIITLSGNDTDSSRASKISQIEAGQFQVLITTGQFLGEGIDIGILDCLFLVYPCSFEGKLTQYIGRVQRSENAPVIYDYRDMGIPYLEKMFQKRNKYYNKLTSSGLIKTYEEYSLKFEEDRFYINNQSNAYPIEILNLRMDIEQFKKDITWRIRVLKYDERESSVFAEILDYNYKPVEIERQFSIAVLPIEEIRFRTTDTDSVLRSVILRKSPVSLPMSTYNSYLIVEEQRIIEKRIKVPFKKIRFGNGVVHVPVSISTIKTTIEIVNEYVRPEFEVIKDYISKTLKTTSVIVDVKIKHDRRNVLSSHGTSEEINSINQEIIDTVRFEFVKREYRKFKGDEGNSMLTIDNLKQSNPDVGALLNDDAALMNELLKIESTRHYLHLKYLSKKHAASILKLRFILQPFSFIFLVEGQKKYHLAWETLDTDEATYLWHIDKTKDALRAAVNEIEIELSKMKLNGRQSYLNIAPEHFSRIIHDYSDVNKGFIDWKDTLEGRLI